MKIFKSLLFIPGNKENMLEKALSFKPRSKEVKGLVKEAAQKLKKKDRKKTARRKK